MRSALPLFLCVFSLFIKCQKKAEEDVPVQRIKGGGVADETEGYKGVSIKGGGVLERSQPSGSVKREGAGKGDEGNDHGGGEFVLFSAVFFGFGFGFARFSLLVETYVFF